MTVQIWLWEKPSPTALPTSDKIRGASDVDTSYYPPEFAVATIRRWWLILGPLAYPKQKHLLSEADGGNPNGNRSRVWKMGRQQLADEFKLTSTVTHYSTGASKWNPIEHRMFNLISTN